MKKLDVVIKSTVLEAIVASDFDLRKAAKELGIGAATIYRMLGRWKLPTPVGGNPGGVKYSEYRGRCQQIEDTLTALR